MILADEFGARRASPLPPVDPQVLAGLLLYPQNAGTTCSG
jgi:hypothetical protein